MFDAECSFNMMMRHFITQDAYGIIWAGHLEIVGLDVAVPSLGLPDRLIYVLLIILFGEPWGAFCATRQWILKWTCLHESPLCTKREVSSKMFNNPCHVSDMRASMPLGVISNASCDAYKSYIVLLGAMRRSFISKRFITTTWRYSYYYWCDRISYFRHLHIKQKCLGISGAWMYVRNFTDHNSKTKDIN